MTETRRYPVPGAGIGRQDYSSPVLGPNAKEMRTERRSTTSNDNGIVNGAPPLIYTGVAMRGKFFPRGCRGKIAQLQIYCRRTGIGSLRLSFSPHPGLGPLYTATVFPGAAWAWVGVNFNQMWNYDSLFVWVGACTVDVSWGAEVAAPYDGHLSTDDGVTWEQQDHRLFIRAEYDGETAGDVPVSGTINTIEIPSSASLMAQGFGVNVPSNTVTTICTALGAGVLVEAKLDFKTSVVPTAGATPAAVVYQLEVLADANQGTLTDNRELTQSCIATFGRCSKGEFWQATVALPAWDRTFMRVRLPLKFRRSLVLRAIQTTGGAVDVDGRIYANLIR